jgi:hypothetical protein
MTDRREPLEDWKCPAHYFGAQWDGWKVAPVGQSRDSDSVERSNFRTIVERLEQVEDDDTEDFIKSGGDEASDFCCGHIVVRERHFLVGWVEWIAVSPHAKRSIEICLDARDELEGHPVLDEDDLESLEAEEAGEDEEEDSDDE